MELSRVTELHYMTPLANLRSIAIRGLLSHARASALKHESVALDSVQDRRSGKQVPGGQMLHSYVNLYLDARNAMMYKLRDVADLIVVRVHPQVLGLPRVVVSDGNAASTGTRFFPSPAGLSHLDAERVYAPSWNDDDPWQKAELKRQRQAEILVPDAVPPELILGCYARHELTARKCRTLAPEWQVEVKPHVYFD